MPVLKIMDEYCKVEEENLLIMRISSLVMINFFSKKFFIVEKFSHVGFFLFFIFYMQIYKKRS